MDSIIVFIVLCQAFGAFVGAGTTIWGELAYLRAMRDGTIDAAERAHLRIIAHGLRFGMTLLLISSFALVVAAYLLEAERQPAVTSSYWALMFIAIIVIAVSWALSRKKISFALGSAVAFTAWWFLAYLTIGRIPELALGATIGFFVVATGIFYGVLAYSRMLTHPKQSPASS